MKIIKLQTRLSREDILEVLKDNDFVNDGVRFNEKKGKPRIILNEKAGDRLTVSCKMIGGATRDNGFIFGATKFRGTLTESGGVTTLRGYMLTAPIYLLALFALLGLFIFMCFYLKGFNPVPPICFIFGILIIADEYKKQGIIERYFYRAFAKAEKKYKKKL
ncbi:MAG: hypothetical protein IJX38_04385 [Clostridia bacterium]|nr:hypothetical protein [Clostridia bacterium]